MRGLKLLTLNIEADRHLVRVQEVIARHLPDIVCLQEVLEPDCAALAAIGGYEVRFGLSAQLPGKGGRHVGMRDWGVAVLARVPVRRQTLIYYADDPRMRPFAVPNDARRLLIMTELEYDGRPYRIATTHFTWSPDGHINDDQRADFTRLSLALAGWPDYVLCGDFNAPRGREMFAKFTDELQLVDHLPRDVTTTIDPAHHYAGDLNLVVDTIFSTPHYAVSDIRVLEGVSDHKGIMAMLGRRPDGES